METIIEELQTSVEPARSGVGPPPPQASHDHSVDIGTAGTLSQLTPSLSCLKRRQTFNVEHLYKHLTLYNPFKPCLFLTRK